MQIVRIDKSGQTGLVWRFHLKIPEAIAHVTFAATFALCHTVGTYSSVPTHLWVCIPAEVTAL